MQHILLNVLGSVCVKEVPKAGILPQGVPNQVGKNENQTHTHTVRCDIILINSSLTAGLLVIMISENKFVIGFIHFFQICIQITWWNHNTIVSPEC